MQLSFRTTEPQEGQKQSRNKREIGDEKKK